MKRAVELRQLSDDHHQGLVQARRLRKAAAGEGAMSHMTRVTRTLTNMKTAGPRRGRRAEKRAARARTSNDPNASTSPKKLAEKSTTWRRNISL